MAKVIFVNPDDPGCGVYQYGLNLFAVLSRSKKHLAMCMTLDEWDYIREVAASWPADLIIWNWHPLIPSKLTQGPPDWRKNILVMHEPTPGESLYHRVIMSDPTQQDNGLRRYIGRPLPEWKINPLNPRERHDRIWVGLQGYNGAWASQMITEIAMKHDLHNITFMLHLPKNRYVDPEGKNARREIDMAYRLACSRGASVHVTEDYISSRDMLDWLALNDVNCYVRPKVPWFGVSSALDPALAVDVPIAINKCPAFRHVWDCEPSICLEDRTLFEIIDSSILPLAPKKKAWSQANILAQLEKVIDEVV